MEQMVTKDVSGLTCDDKYVNRQVERGNNEKGNLTDCPVCKGKTIVYKAVWDEDLGYWSCVGSRCKCRATYDSRQRLKKSGLEMIVDGKTFDNYVVENEAQHIAKTKAQRYENGWFYIGGQSGFGKTHLCTAIAAKKIDGGVETLYMPWVDVIGDLKREYYRDGFTELLDKYKRIKFLYIDDLFKVKDLDATHIQRVEMEIAYQLLNYRYINNLDTVISSEFKLDELNKMDSAIAGRIKEKCGENFVGVSKDANKNWRTKH